MQLYNAILHACIRVDLCFCRNRNRKLSMFASFCLCARALFTRLITASTLRPNVVIGCTSVRLLVCISASLSLSREHSNPTYFLPFLSACLPVCLSGGSRILCLGGAYGGGHFCLGGLMGLKRRRRETAIADGKKPLTTRGSEGAS